MYCLSCGTSLPEEALFCFKCGKLISREPEHIPTFVSVPAPSDPYSTQSPSTSYGSQSPSEGTLDRSAPPPPPRPPRRFLKGLLIGMIAVLLLGSGLGALLFFKRGALFPTLPPQATTQSTSQPTATATFQATTQSTSQPTATATPPLANTPRAGVLYTADWSSGLNGWYELPGFRDWKVDGNMLRNDGTNSGGTAPGIEAAYEVASTSDYAIETEVQVVQGEQPCFDITTIRTNASWSGYKAVLCTGNAMLKKGNGAPRGVVTIASTPFNSDNGWHTYRLEAKGDTLRLLIDGNQVLLAHDTTYMSGGKLGMNSFKTQLNVRSYEVFAL